MSGRSRAASRDGRSAAGRLPDHRRSHRPRAWRALRHGSPRGRRRAGRIRYTARSSHGRVAAGTGLALVHFGGQHRCRRARPVYVRLRFGRMRREVDGARRPAEREKHHVQVLAGDRRRSCRRSPCPSGPPRRTLRAPSTCRSTPRTRTSCRVPDFARGLPRSTSAAGSDHVTNGRSADPRGAADEASPYLAAQYQTFTFGRYRARPVVPKPRRCWRRWPPP